MILEPGSFKKQEPTLSNIMRNSQISLNHTTQIMGTPAVKSKLIKHNQRLLNKSVVEQEGVLR